jgi:hypothetical protein
MVTTQLLGRRHQCLVLARLSNGLRAGFCPFFLRKPLQGESAESTLYRISKLLISFKV